MAGIEVKMVEVKNVLTRTSGFLKTVTSHSLQPYRGCTFGRSLCGMGCYVQHNRFLTKGRTWGSFLDVRVNAAQSYSDGYRRERDWARRSRGGFSIFLSSATEPFLPQEFRYGITRKVLECMREQPPDELVVQTHSHRVAEYGGLLEELNGRCSLRVHISIETDRERIAGLPPPPSPVSKRFEAARSLRELGIRSVITVSPLLPIQDPDRFFQRVSECADAVVIDHFIEGDGTPDGRRTRQTPVPDAMAGLEPDSVGLEYRDAMVEIAQRWLPGRVGVNIDGFAGRGMRGDFTSSCAKRSAGR